MRKRVFGRDEELADALEMDEDRVRKLPDGKLVDKLVRCGADEKLYEREYMPRGFPPVWRLDRVDSRDTDAELYGDIIISSAALWSGSDKDACPHT